MDKQKKSWLGRLWQRIGAGVIADVPSELYACEVCRKTQCTQGEWVVCENRIAQAKLLEAIQDRKRS